MHEFLSFVSVMSWSCFFLSVASAALEGAGVTFGDSFLGDRAVIQRDLATEVWGSGSAACRGAVEILINDVVVANATVDATSLRWRADLPPRAAVFGTTLSARCVAEPSLKATVSVDFGDVLMCGGQSNAGLAVGKGNFTAGRDAPAYGFHADNGTAESAASTRYSGRIALKALSGRPTSNAGIPMAARTWWHDTSPDTLPYFSAVCW
eukprot:g5698.t1